MSDSPALNFKENGEEYMVGFGRKWKGKLLQLNYNLQSKTKTITQRNTCFISKFYTMSASQLH